MAWRSTQYFPGHTNSLVAFHAGGREGVFTAGMLGLGPTLRRSAEDAGYSKPQAAMAGALGGGVIVASLSHPMDTIKTCQQGDVTQKTYRGVVHAGVEITGTTSRRWRGAPEI